MGPFFRTAIQAHDTIFCSRDKLSPSLSLSLTVPRIVSSAQNPNADKPNKKLTHPAFLSLSKNHTSSTLPAAVSMASTAAQIMSRLISVSISSPKPLSPLSRPTATASLLSSSSSLSLNLRRNRNRRRPTPLHFSTATPLKVSATISVGSPLPNSTLSYFPPTSDDLQTVSISDLTKSKKAILFAVPGAFTPTCSQKHLPSFVEKAAELKSKGVDTIACISVNDAFVMKAWKKDLGIGDEIMLLSDGNGDFTKAIVCDLDLSDKP